jgi:ribosomal-protein-alanine N-acetyltransferase
VTGDDHSSVEDLEYWIQRDDPAASLGRLAAVRKDTREADRLLQSHRERPWPDDEPELAYEFLRREWGPELATEAGHGIIGWAEPLGYNRPRATVRDWNTTSRRVMAEFDFLQTSRVEPDAEHGDLLFCQRPRRHALSPFTDGPQLIFQSPSGRRGTSGVAVGTMMNPRPPLPVWGSDDRQRAPSKCIGAACSGATTGPTSPNL